MKYLILSLCLASASVSAQNDEACLELLRGSLIAVQNGDAKHEAYLYGRFEKECEITKGLHDLGETDEQYGNLYRELISQGLI